MATNKIGPDSYGLKVALVCAEMGWPVFPLKPDSKQPIPGTHGHLDAVTDSARIRALWRHAALYGYADPGVGVQCRDQAGFAVDLDVKNGKDGIREFSSLMLEHTGHEFAGDNLPLGWLVYRTHSGGMHIIFQSPARDVHTGSDVLGPGIDLRGPRGYRAVYDPSHPKSYRMMQGYFRSIYLPVCSVIPEAPAWLLADERLYAPPRADYQRVTLPEGPRCPVVTSALSPDHWDFTDHHATATRITYLVRLTEEGHTGVADALPALREAYIAGRNWKSSQDGAPRDPEGDFDRMLQGALAKGMASPAEFDPCVSPFSNRSRF